MARILVVDDDPSLVRALRLGLRSTGHEVIVASSGEQGLMQAALGHADLIILDLGLPDIDGLNVCKQIRSWSDVPIVVLSANDTEDRKVASLDAGADDYVTKPFGMAELEARIRTAMRHRNPEHGGNEQQPGEAVLKAGGIILDLAHRTMTVNGAIVRLTAKEFDVLSFLLRHIDKVCTHQMILSAVWGTPYTKESQYLHVYVNRLRHKLGDASSVTLSSVPGIGYLLSARQTSA